MGDGLEGILSTKIDLLLKDFREFKTDQKETNKDLRIHAAAEDKVQASIAATVKWHSIIGGFVMVAFISFGTYRHLASESTSALVSQMYIGGAYYRENKATTIEIIELYKTHDLCTDNIKGLLK